MSSPYRFWFGSIKHRRGFVEVAPGIHAGKVNLDVFEISVEAHVDDAKWVDDPRLDDTDVVANTELELTAEEAEALARALLEAAANVRTEQE